MLNVLKELAHVIRSIMETHIPVVDLNVSLSTTVLMTKLVFAINAKILVLEHVLKTLYAMLSTIRQCVTVLQVLLETPLSIVDQYHVCLKFSESLKPLKLIFNNKICI